MRFNRSLCVTIPFFLKKNLEPRVWKQNLLKMLLHYPVMMTTSQNKMQLCLCLCTWTI